VIRGPSPIEFDLALEPRRVFERLAWRAGSSTKPAPTPTPTKVGRNDPCPCGSGKKVKKCCGKAA
jgi:uncharacterized protein YecA (UPF0149 family)